MPLTTRYGFTDTPTPGNPTTAWTTVASLFSSGSTSLSVTSSANFPASVEFDAIIGVLGSGVLTNAERIHVTAVSGTTWTVQRTVATDHAAGESIYHELTATGLQNSPGAMTDSGDQQYLASTGRTARFAIGTNLQVQCTDGTTPVWVSSTGTDNIVRATAPTLTGPVTINESVGSSALTLTGATQTSSFPVFSASQTFNSGGTTFTGWLLNITPTASASASKLFDIQRSGSSAVSVGTDGNLVVNQIASAVSTRMLDVQHNGTRLFTVTDGDSQFADVASSARGKVNVGGGGMILQVDASDKWIQWGGSSAVYLQSSNVLAQRNSTNAQTLQVYNTYTSSTNNEYFTQTWSSNVLHLRADKGSGGGTARVVQVDYGGTTTAAISVPITSGDVTFGGGLIIADATKILKTTTAFNNGAGASVGTLTNAPAATNPTKWIPIDDNGTTRYIPAW